MVCVFRLSGQDESEAIQTVPDGRTGQSKGQAGQSKGQAKVTTMLLVVSFAWVILTTPFATIGFVVAVGDIDAALVAALMPLKAVAFLLMYTNHAVNFYLYCITGCRFRQELDDMLSGWKRAVVERCCSGDARQRFQLSLRRSTRWTMTTGNGGCGGALMTRGSGTARAAAAGHGCTEHHV